VVRCREALIVLRADGADTFYVLTAYRRRANERREEGRRVLCRPTIRLCGSPCGYLHEDFQETSGTVAEAMEAFLNEASAERCSRCAKSGSDCANSLPSAAEGAADGAGAAGNCVATRVGRGVAGLDEILTRGKA